MQCWHLKQERWKTTPSVESWSIGYTVLVHTLHFCCVPLNIFSRSPANPSLYSLCPSHGWWPARSESPIRPWPARAWRGMKSTNSSPRRPDCRVYIRRTAGARDAIKRWNYDGRARSSPPAQARPRLTFAAAERKRQRQQQTSDDGGWESDDGGTGTALHSTVPSCCSLN